MKLDPPAWAANFTAAATEFLRREQTQKIIEWIKEPVLAVLSVYVVMTVVVQTFYVPSGSMQPTIAIGDVVLATKFSYGYDRYSLPFVNGPSPSSRFLGRMPNVGDVVMFRLPRDNSIAFVKRVIGLPGDRIQMNAGRLYINGKELPLRPAGTGPDEWGPDDHGPAGDYVDTPEYIETLPDGVEHPIYKSTWDGPTDNTAVYVVPQGHLFMMGDNRDDSDDSRVPPSEGGVGYVPYGNLVGRAFVIIASVDFPNADNLLEWPLEFRFSRLLKFVR